MSICSNFYLNKYQTMFKKQTEKILKKYYF